MSKLEELNKLIEENNESIKRLADLVATPVYVKEKDAQNNKDTSRLPQMPQHTNQDAI